VSESEINLANELTGAYRSSIDLSTHLRLAGLSVISRDAAELRELVFAEMLALYLQTTDTEVRSYFHSVGIGDRLLDDARSILRSEGQRRRASLQTLATNHQKLREGPEVLLLDGVRRSVAEVSY